MRSPNDTAVTAGHGCSGAAPVWSRTLTAVRSLIHRRYVRAAVSGVSLGAIGLSLGAATLEVRHQVTHRAVVRYFARDRLTEANLTRRIRNPYTTSQLGRLVQDEADGGFVYAHQGALWFYPCVTAEFVAWRRDQVENLAIFPRLTLPYYTANLDGLLEELSADDVQARLRREGVHPWTVRRLRQRSSESGREDDRRRLLRAAARLMLPFAPYRGLRYEIPFGEALRFYERENPAGRFVGLYEVSGPLLTGGSPDVHALEMSQRNHYLTVETRRDRSYLLSDYFQGTARRYSIRPFLHPSGTTMYRVTPLRAGRSRVDSVRRSPRRSS